MDKIGKRFKEFREALNFNQKEFSTKIELSQQVISGIEKGRNFPTIPTLVKLIKDYRININWLLNNEGNMFMQENNTEPYEELLDRMEARVKNILLEYGLIDRIK